MFHLFHLRPACFLHALAMFSYQPLVALRLLTIEAVVMLGFPLHGFHWSQTNGAPPRPPANPIMDIPHSQWLQYASALEHVCSCFWFSVVQERWHVLKDRVLQTFIPFYMILSSLRIQSYTHVVLHSVSTTAKID